MRRLARGLVRGLRVTTRPSHLDRPVFIVGTVRSGSTVLATSLGGHPQLHHGGFELSEKWSQLGGVEIACPETRDLRCPERLADSYDPEEMRRLEKGLAAIVAAGRAPAKRLLNKNPHFWNKLELVHRAFPDSALMITSRDIRNTVISTMKLWQMLDDNHGLRHHLPVSPTACWDLVMADSAENHDPDRLFPGGDPSVLAEYWLRCYERIEIDRHLFASNHIVLFRDFVQAPEQVLQAVAADLGLKQDRFDLGGTIDSSRDARPKDAPSTQDLARLDDFIGSNLNRIRSIECADSSVGS